MGEIDDHFRGTPAVRRRRLGRGPGRTGRDRRSGATRRVVVEIGEVTIDLGDGAPQTAPEASAPALGFDADALPSGSRTASRGSGSSPSPHQETSVEEAHGSQDRLSRERHELPPLIFRFQFNPELLTEKKTFKYDPANSVRQVGLRPDRGGERSSAGSRASTRMWRRWGSLLIGVKPLEPVEGEPRTFELEFKLDASVPGPLDGDDHSAAASGPTSPCSARSWCRPGRRPTSPRCSSAGKWAASRTPGVHAQLRGL